jgi:antagonist of KipI
MSLRVTKAGVYDTLQDEGRFGYQHLGVNPNGAMDVHSSAVANALVGNPQNSAVIEMSFPAASYYFKSGALIAMSGADFAPVLNGSKVPLNTPIMVAPESELKFTKVLSGRFCYLAVMGGFSVHTVLESASTNLVAGFGGVNGRKLKKGDEIRLNVGLHEETKIFSWKANRPKFDEDRNGLSFFRCIPGKEFEWLTKKSQKEFTKHRFVLSAQSNRMGYPLAGVELKQKIKDQLVSTAVTKGTVQLLPDGNLIVLMADHQTTGGYPRVAHLIEPDTSHFAQCRAGSKIGFQCISIQEAEQMADVYYRDIRQMRSACLYKLKEYALL